MAAVVVPVLSDIKCSPIQLEENDTKARAASMLCAQALEMLIFAEPHNLKFPTESIRGTLPCENGKNVHGLYLLYFIIARCMTTCIYRRSNVLPGHSYRRERDRSIAWSRSAFDATSVGPIRKGFFSKIT